MELSIIRIEDIAHVGFTAPDLDAMADFLSDFGLQPAGGDAEERYFRGTGSAPFVHRTRRGAAGFAALGLRAESVADLETLAAAEGVAVEDFDAPGGGKVVRLTDPDGYAVEVVAGQAQATPLLLADAAPVNTARAKARLRATKTSTAQPATVVRLGHCVLGVSDFRASEAWYKARFGFITSDEIAVAPNFSIGAFMRCDRGETPTDHHTLFLLQGPGGASFNHAAFEVVDLDDLMHGHDHLKARGREADWGVGRHILGSQIFDYWRDPWGHTLEHWTDGDLFTAADGSNMADLPTLMGVQWGMKMPARG
jgi:catechol 2,3-dioxygenase-like lactoylglutathione lyase family enzyme